MNLELSGKHLELAGQLAPAGKPIGYLWHDDNGRMGKIGC